MRPRTEISAAQAGAIHRAMLAAPGKSVFQRLQCLWLRAGQDLSTQAIAQAVGLSVSHVRRVTPRPKHPKDNPAARAAFKKTSGQSGRCGGWAPAPAAASDVRG
jgi:hypothetical protein